MCEGVSRRTHIHAASTVGHRARIELLVEGEGRHGWWIRKGGEGRRTGEGVRVWWKKRRRRRKEEKKEENEKREKEKRVRR